MEEERIESFLCRLGLGDKTEAFIEQDIELNLLLSLNEPDLKETLQQMNFTLGIQLQIRKGIKELKKQKEAVLKKKSSLLGSDRHDTSKETGAELERSLLRSEENDTSKENDAVSDRESLSPGSQKDDTSKDIKSWKEKEIRIVLIGKTGSGKSATGNSILGDKMFKSSVSGSSITNKCSQHSAERFNHNILIVDTPGIFDTKKSNKKIQEEILRCIAITAPGPHAFILVLCISRHTEEEQKSIQHFVDSFGEHIFKYFIVIFTRKDDLDEDGKSLEDHIETVPQNLQKFIAKCGRRIIAFNNRLKGEESDKQVEELLSMVYANVEKNNGECYSNEMYIAAEQLLIKREAEIREQAKKEEEKRIEEIENKLKEEFLKEAEKNKTQTEEENMKWREEFAKKQEEILEAEKRKAEIQYERVAEMARKIAREEAEKGNNRGFFGKLWDYGHSILPRVFWR